MEFLKWSWYVAYVLVLLGLSGYGFHRLCIVYLYLRHSWKRPNAGKQFDELPVVTVQLPVFNEMHVVERLLTSVSKIDYPREKMQIQLLDDSTDETTGIGSREIEKLKSQGFDAEFIHREDRTGFKAGALENGLETAKGDYVLILDADFVPNPDILQKTIHYFTDEKIGLIQTRWGHLNRNFNLLTRIQAMFLDGHLELEQTARNRSGRFFTFNGTGGIWRKECIADAGGWEHDTLTEDMDLSYRAQLRHWRFIFLNEVETPAELPVDMDGFKSQQHRWTKGSIQCCKKVLPAIWKSRFPIQVKLEATAHLTSNFAWLLLMVLCFLIFPNTKYQPEMSLWVKALIHIPIFIFASGAVAFFYLMAQKALHPREWWKEVLYLPCLLALGIGMSINNARAVMEALLNMESGFVRTPKYGVSKAKAEKSTQLRKRRYKAMRSVTPVVEFLFGLFFLFILIDALLSGNYVSFIFLLPFPLGFFYTSISSFAISWNSAASGHQSE